jgi:hypothetical protein
MDGMIDVVTKEEWAGRCYNAEERLAAAHARIAELEAYIAKSLVQARSDAISEFCAGAKILASTQVKHLPADVRVFRMESAIAALVT